MLKTINVSFEEAEFVELLETKGLATWREFILMMTEGTSKHRVELVLAMNEWLTVTDKLALAINKLDDADSEFYNGIRDKIVSACAQLDKIVSAYTHYLSG